MSKDCVLGIDIGTSGVRIVASDRSGALLAISKAPIIAPIQDSGRSLQDPKIWWTAVEQAFALLDLKGLNVLALAIDGTSGTILAVDRNGEPLGLASSIDLEEIKLRTRLQRHGCADGAHAGHLMVHVGVDRPMREDNVRFLGRQHLLEVIHLGAREIGRAIDLSGE